MGKLLQLVGALVAYFCIATVLSMGVIAFVFVQRVELTKEKWSRMLAAAYGLDLPTGPAHAANASEVASVEQPSYEQLLEARAVKTRNLELREQALREGLDQLRNEQRRIVEEKRRFKQIREGFDAELLAMREGAAATGLEDVRRTLETIKPKQAKDQIVKMLANDQIDEVVMLISEMPDTKRAKIISEFKTPEEADQLSQILQRIRDGVPTVETADKTRDQLAPKPGTP